MKKLSLIGTLMILSLTASAGDKNICDDLIDNGAPQRAIEMCWEKHGKSKHYLESQEELQRSAEDRELQEREVQAQTEREENRLRRLREAITEQTFSFLDLKESGFGLPYIAKQTTYKYDSRGFIKGQEDEMITSGAEICKYLGFEKAKAVVINRKGLSARDAKGQALFIETKDPLFGSKSYKQQVFTSNKKGRKVYYFQSVTCVRSRIADNEMMDHVKEIISYLEADLQTGAPINKPSTRVNNRNRHGEDDNDDTDYDTDNDEFTYTPRSSGR